MKSGIVFFFFFKQLLGFTAIIQLNETMFLGCICLSSNNSKKLVTQNIDTKSKV